MKRRRHRRLDAQLGDGSDDSVQSSTAMWGQPNPKPSPSCYLLPLRFLRRRSTAQRRFFCGSGDLLLRRDQIPFNPIGAQRHVAILRRRERQ
ncbi:hypothetical protein MRB53_020436 [Persea americana]|uniref:Uncharacterized protein n=1 Tax=Persea americana TaxID=3435 RepID=A0ACC2L0Y7_PERAE|nr:hypothetical protein MRB53_020436 [Persea americana]